MPIGLRKNCDSCHIVVIVADVPSVERQKVRGLKQAILKANRARKVGTGRVWRDAEGRDIKRKPRERRKSILGTLLA